MNLPIDMTGMAGPRLALLVLLVLSSLPALAVDTDSDGVLDDTDNCTAVSNANQRDTNGDGYGNQCDADLDNDLDTDTMDLNAYKLAHRSVLGSVNYSTDADFNGDNKIDTFDLNIFRTLYRLPPGPSAPPQPAFSFTTYGDSRAGGSPPCDGNKIHRTLVGLMAAENTAFTVHNGDMIEGFGSDTNFIQDGNCTAPDSFGSLKNLIEPLQSRPAPAGLPMSFFPVIGNHDDAWAIGWYPDSFGNGICDVFNMGALVPNHTQKPWFSLNKSTSHSDAVFSDRLCSKVKPGVLIAGVEQPDIYPRYAYYSFDYQNSHFVVLHLNRDIDDVEECNSCGSDKTDYDDYYNIHQLDFVKADLAAARGNSAIANIFVFLHVPLFGTSDSHINNPSWQALGKVFTNNGVKPVKAVFSGHSHVYERSKRIAIDTAHPTGVENNTTGTAYITTGGGGSPLNGWNPIQWYTAFRYAAYHYVRVDVVGSQTTIKVVGYDPATPPAPTFTIETLTW